MSDRYTPTVLRQAFNLHRTYVLGLHSLAEEHSIDIRNPTMPEHISENVAKFIIRRHDPTSKWTKGTELKTKGDLISEKEGQQEVKCFTSDGPPSFGPTEAWDTLYFLDARDWLNSRFILWRVPHKNDSVIWKNLQVNKTQTFEDQCKQGRRPRLSWPAIESQLGTNATKMFEGTIEEVLAGLQ